MTHREARSVSSLWPDRPVPPHSLESSPTGLFRPARHALSISTECAFCLDCSPHMTTWLNPSSLTYFCPSSFFMKAVLTSWLKTLPWPGTPNFRALLPLPPPWSSSPSNTNHSLYLVFIFYFPHWTVCTKSAGGFVCLVHWCSINTFDQIKAWTYSFRFPLSFSAPVQREKPYCCPFSILTWIHQKKLLMLVCLMIQMMPESCNHYIRLFRR